MFKIICTYLLLEITFDRIVVHKGSLLNSILVDENSNGHLNLNFGMIHLTIEGTWR